jgi:hypothetical protein
MYKIIFGIFTLVVFGVIIGFKLSAEINHPTLYFLFWIMYFTTFVTTMSLLFNVSSFSSIRTKKGPDGKKGPVGDAGDIGDDGECEANCRDELCFKELMKFSNQKLNEIAKVDPPIEIKNKYWKDRISLICGSKEFSNLIVVKGRQEVINYVKTILTEWLKLLYLEGNRIFFETIGAENEFEWRKQNPWHEIKKYDIYYWGMDPHFRIRQFSKCIKPTFTEKKPRLKLLPSNQYSYIWEESNEYRNTRPKGTSLWRPNILTKDGVTYYPMGDVFSTANKNTAECGKGEKRMGRVTIKYDGCAGPDDLTMLVSGDVKSPTDYKHIATSYYRYCGGGAGGWFCRKSNWKIGSRKKSRAQHYRPVPPEGYVCLGDITVTDVNQLDKIKQNYKCVPKECAEKIEVQTPVVLQSKRGDEAIHHAIGKDGDNTYNLFRTRLRSDKDPIMLNSMYKIKEECLNPVNITPSKNDKNDKNDKYSDGYYPNQIKDNKYSVLHYLGLPTEATLVNNGNNRIFIKIQHVNGEKYNIYHISMFENNDDERLDEPDNKNDVNIQLLEAFDNYTTRWQKVRTPNENFNWAINIDKSKYGELTIQSRNNNGYLRAMTPYDIKTVPPNKVDKYAYWKIM